MRGFLAVIGIGFVALGCGRPAGPPAPPTSEILASADPDLHSLDRPATDTGVENRQPLLPPEWSSGDWPGWRGAAQDGVATGVPVPTEWTETRNVLWKTPLPGRGHGSPIVLGSSIYLETADDEVQVQSVMAIDRTRGRKLWKTDLHKGAFDQRLHAENTQASSTLATDGERLFAVFLNNQRIWCSALDLKGEELWRMEVGGFQSRFGFSTSPIIGGPYVYIAADHEDGGFIAALRRDTGNIVWRRKRGQFASYASPRLVKLGEKSLLVLSGGGAITAYHPASGDELWSVPGTAQSTVSTVVTYRDFVIASGGYQGSETVALRADGSVAWRNKEMTYVPSMIVVDDHLYAVQDDGIARCWNAATGKERWKHRLGGKYRVSPVLSGDNLIVTDMAGKTVVFRADPNRFELIAENQLGTDGFASPA
ncbi:MAG: PQQ-binding-like beta-propeller repeat protein, partial [Planctomycetaceae bacterium]|nr:PQQ-binding-like beta-propeller repeat protein [Planctomycetaceae bacterium]